MPSLLASWPSPTSPASWASPVSSASSAEASESTSLPSTSMAAPPLAAGLSLLVSCASWPSPSSRSEPESSESRVAGGFLAFLALSAAGNVPPAASHRFFSSSDSRMKRACSSSLTCFHAWPYQSRWLLNRAESSSPSASASMANWRSSLYRCLVVGAPIQHW